ncbi:RNA-binding protein [Planoprotostelium fungivorum]|uniref:RNA-binding protein n=1 Tax=Planoprotostelium fungivorum TaxID=1890364 RepID=A0A2P6N9U1_9EUKA|nr:RNA-binding protein [Planoprotostelium fungivorum]
MLLENTDFEMCSFTQNEGEKSAGRVGSFNPNWYRQPIRPIEGLVGTNQYSGDEKRITCHQVPTITYRLFSTLTLTNSNVLSARFTVEDSFFGLINTNLIVQEFLSVNLNGTNSSRLELSNSAINTFGFTSADLSGGRFDIQSDLIWNGLLNISDFNITTDSIKSTIDTTLAATSWTVQNSTLKVTVLAFNVPLTLINVTHNADQDDRSEGLYFNRNTSIINSTLLQYIRHCLQCNVNDSTLHNLPSSSTIHLSGSIFLAIQIERHPHRAGAIANSTIEASSDLYVISSGLSLSFDGVTLVSPDTSSVRWEASYLLITDSTIRGSWSFSSLASIDSMKLPSKMERTNCTSHLDLGGSWELSQVQAPSITVEEINLFNAVEMSVDTDRLIIGQLTARYGTIDLSRTSRYTIYNLSLHVSDSETRAFTPTFQSSTTRPLCMEHTNPTPNITYGWSDGINTYFHLAGGLRQICTDNLLDYHDLLVVDEDGHTREISGEVRGSPATYRSKALPVEDGCTSKRVTVQLRRKSMGAITSKGRQVEILPGDVVNSEYYPWGNYNETNFWMGALSGENAGKIQLNWNASGVHQPCGYKAEVFTFGNDSALVSHGKLTLQAETFQLLNCSQLAATVPAFSIFYSKDDHYVYRPPYVPYAHNIYPPDDFLKSLIPVDPSITPEDFNLVIDAAATRRDDLAWTMSNLPQINCPCGEYEIILRIHHTNGTWIKSETFYTGSKHVLNLPYGRYVVYATGVCALPIRWTESPVGGYGRTIGKEIDLVDPNKMNWIVPVSVVGGIVVVIAVVVAIVVVRRRRQRQRVDYAQIHACPSSIKPLGHFGNCSRCELQQSQLIDPDQNLIGMSEAHDLSSKQALLVDQIDDIISAANQRIEKNAATSDDTVIRYNSSPKSTYLIEDDEVFFRGVIEFDGYLDESKHLHRFRKKMRFSQTEKEETEIEDTSRIEVEGTHLSPSDRAKFGEFHRELQRIGKQQFVEQLPSELISLMKNTTEIEEACKELDITSLSDSIIQSLCTSLILPEISLQRNIILIRSVLLPRVVSLNRAAPRLLLNTITECSRKHTKAVVYSLFLPLLMEDRFGTAQCEIVNHVTKECLSPHMSLTFLQSLLMMYDAIQRKDLSRGEEAEADTFILLSEMIQWKGGFEKCKEKQWNELIVSIIVSILSVRMVIGPHTMSHLVMQIEGQAVHFPKSSKFANMVLVLPHREQLKRVLSGVESFVSKSAISKLDALNEIDTGYITTGEVLLIQFPGGEVPNQESNSLDIQYSRMTLRYMILVNMKDNSCNHRCQIASTADTCCMCRDKTNKAQMKTSLIFKDNEYFITDDCAAFYCSDCQSAEFVARQRHSTWEIKSCGHNQCHTLGGSCCACGDKRKGQGTAYIDGVGLVKQKDESAHYCPGCRDDVVVPKKNQKITLVTSKVVGDICNGTAPAPRIRKEDTSASRGYFKLLDIGFTPEEAAQGVLRLIVRGRINTSDSSIHRQHPPMVCRVESERKEVPEQDASDESGRRCHICFETAIDSVTVPCGHTAMCHACSVRVTNSSCPSCPICRTPTTMVVRMYKVCTTHTTTLHSLFKV